MVLILTVFPTARIRDRLDRVMLQRVVLGQVRFNLPGLAADARGVVIGRQLAVAVRSHRSAGRPSCALLSAEQSLDDLQPGLRIVYARGGAGTREAIVLMPVRIPGAGATSSRRRPGSPGARRSPGRASSSCSTATPGRRSATTSRCCPTRPGDLILYGFEQIVAYRIESELPLAKLLLRLSLVRAQRPRTERPCPTGRCT